MASSSLIAALLTLSASTTCYLSPAASTLSLSPSSLAARMTSSTLLPLYSTSSLNLATSARKCAASCTNPNFSCFTDSKC